MAASFASDITDILNMGGQMHAQPTARRKEDIERMLAHGLTPVTDNLDALVDLGFVPSYASGWANGEAAVWERSIDAGTRATNAGLRRVMTRQRAFLRTFG
jgi:hypothetical protein